MQFVNDRFYLWYNRVATFVGVVYLTLTIAAWSPLKLVALKDQWGFTPAIGVIAVVQIVFGLIVYRRIALTNPWTAGLLASMILSLNNITLIHNSGQLHSKLLILWGIQIALSGIFGLYTVVGYGFLVTIYYVLETTGTTNEKLFDPYALGIVAGTYILGLASYFIWKNFYVDSESQKVSQLTGQLRNKQKQAEILIYSISDGIILTDTEGKISLINPAAAKMTGWTVEEASGINVSSVIKLTSEEGEPIENNENPFGVVLSKKEPISRILGLVSRDEKRQVVSLVVSPVNLPKNNEFIGTVAVLRDVSNERKEEKQRADFISTASHEMRTPVAAIEGYLALSLNEQVAKIDSKARDYLEKAHTNTQHLGKLFQDLLTSARAEDGRLVNHPEVIEMGGFLEQLTEGVRFTAEKKGLFVEYLIGSGSESNLQGTKVVKPLYYLYADPERLREVITNLFDNAVKYTDKGRISIGLTGNNEVVQIYVKDTGPGIPAEDISHLFQKFYRVDSSITRTIGGTGLGLFICRKIVELYNGRIWVESDVGKGSSFFINLPRIDSHKADQLKASSKIGSP